MTPAKLALAVAVLFLALWLAYRIGIVILRLAAGLLFLGLVAFAVWHFFLR